MPSWALDFTMIELFSYGRVALPAILANYQGKSDMPIAELLRPACRKYFRPEAEEKDLHEALGRFPSNGDPLWPALARHVARCSTEEDRALLEQLAKTPDLREAPLRWGLQYIVRGDIVMDDGAVVTLDELAEAAGVPPLPYLEEMPEPVAMEEA